MSASEDQFVGHELQEIRAALRMTQDEAWARAVEMIHDAEQEFAE